jgi:hypothetical protein
MTSTVDDLWEDAQSALSQLVETRMRYSITPKEEAPKFTFKFRVDQKDHREALKQALYHTSKSLSMMYLLESCERQQVTSDIHGALDLMIKLAAALEVKGACEDIGPEEIHNLFQPLLLFGLG